MYQHQRLSRSQFPLIGNSNTSKGCVNIELQSTTLLGREAPELPMRVLFRETEIGVLKDFARNYRLAVPGRL